MKTLLYSLKVWLTSAFLAPLLYAIIEYFIKKSYNTNGLNNAIEMYTMYTVFGLIFSFLTWIAFTIIIFGIAYFDLPKEIKQPLIVILSVTLTVGTFVLVFSWTVLDPNDEFFYLALANCLCIGAGSWFYKSPVIET